MVLAPAILVELFMDMLPVTDRRARAFAEYELLSTVSRRFRHAKACLAVAISSLNVTILTALAVRKTLSNSLQNLRLAF